MQRLLGSTSRDVLFLLAERAPQFRRWRPHPHPGCGCEQGVPRVALLRINDGQARGGLPLGCGFLIQPQIALAGLGVGTMALKALIREDGEYPG